MSNLSVVSPLLALSPSVSTLRSSSRCALSVFTASAARPLTRAGLQALNKETVIQRVAALRRRFDGVKIIVGVDRLDYIKGVPQKLHAMEVFLDEHPEWIGKVVLVQVAVPSRQDVEEYQNLRASVNELVGRINGRFGTVEFMPIHFMHRSIPFEELTALYAVSDACLITSTRDGMNLVRSLPLVCR